LDYQGLSAAAGELIAQLRVLDRIDVGRDDASVQIRESQRDRAADAGACASHESGFPARVIAICPLPRRETRPDIMS